MQRRLSFISTCLGREGRRRWWESNLDLVHSIKQYHVAWFIRPQSETPSRALCAAHTWVWHGLKCAIKGRNLPSRSLCSLWLIHSLAWAVCVQTDNIVVQACVRQPYDACCGRGADTAVDSHKCRCPGAGGLEEPLILHLLLCTIGCRVEHCSAVALVAVKEKWTRSAMLSHLRHFFVLTLCYYRTITQLTLCYLVL